MHLVQGSAFCEGIAIRAIGEDGAEIGRCRLYLMENEGHSRPLAYIEDVFVDPGHRSKGVGASVVREAVETARRRGCYKVVLSARHGRPDLHRWYEKLGFVDHGRSFRIDL